MAGKVRRLSMTAGNQLASLEGRKTKTRRCFRGEQPPEGWAPEVGYYCPTEIDRHGEEYPGDEIFGASDADWGRKSPYGAPGDPLVLTESWRPLVIKRDWAMIKYRADGKIARKRMPDDDAREKIKRALEHGRWMPPMFQQVWASRAPAVVKSIRVERVQEISIDDAVAEGTRCHLCGGPMDGSVINDCPCIDTEDSVLASFKVLWDSINKSRGHGWDVNDWVWCVAYELTT